MIGNCVTMSLKITVFTLLIKLIFLEKPEPIEELATGLYFYKIK